MAKRAVVLFGCVTTALFLCILSVYRVSDGTGLAQAAARQQKYVLTVASTRGTIYDCNGNALTGTGKKETVAAVVPGIEADAALNRTLPADRMKEVLPLLEEGKPFTLKLPQAVSCEGIRVFSVAGRYSYPQPAAHILGSLDGSGKGTSGIEKAFDRQLSAGQGRIVVSYPVDAMNRILPGEKETVTDTTARQKSGVVLTLDSRIQSLAERAADRYLDRGAVVVLEVPSGKIRAMVSRPDFSPDDVASVLKDEDSPLLNRATSAYSVGSVFKLAAAAAALESGISPGETYTCTGGIEVDGTVFHCFNSESHGTETMKEAIARSCNTYFVHLMQKVPQEKFLQTARSLGFGQSFEIAPGVVSAAGVLPKPESLKIPRALANFSFGQGELTATPLQIAGMVNAIAADGRFTQPYLYEGLVDEAMEFTEKARQPGGQQVLQPRTARLLREFMQASVEGGTGKKGKPAHGGAGAKTATAQTGKYVDGKEQVQSWYAGFYPYQNPKYAVVVFAEGGDGGGTTCGPAFRDIADGLYGLGLAG